MTHTFKRSNDHFQSNSLLDDSFVSSTGTLDEEEFDS